MNKALILTLGTALLLTGCSSREEADAKLAKACEAGVKSMLSKPLYDRQIEKVKNVTYDKERKFRVVKLNTEIKTKEYSTPGEEAFSCVFAEQYSMGFMGWSAQLERLTIGETTYGRDEKGDLKGDLNDYMMLTDKVDEALGN